VGAACERSAVTTASLQVQPPGSSSRRTYSLTLLKLCCFNWALQCIIHCLCDKWGRTHVATSHTTPTLAPLPAALPKDRGHTCCWDCPAAIAAQSCHMTRQPAYTHMHSWPSVYMHSRGIANQLQHLSASPSYNNRCQQVLWCSRTGR
jgi:hypothetical protein